MKIAELLAAAKRAETYPAYVRTDFWGPLDEFLYASPWQLTDRPDLLESG